MASKKLTSCEQGYEYAFCEHCRLQCDRNLVNDNVTTVGRVDLSNLGPESRDEQFDIDEATELLRRSHNRLYLAAQ